jgi:hypothetical protein
LSPRKPVVETEAEVEVEEPAPKAEPPRTPSQPELLYGEPYDLAEASAEAVRIGGGTREEIAKAAAAAIAGKVPPYEASVITALVTQSSMLRSRPADEPRKIDIGARLRRSWLEAADESSPVDPDGDERTDLGGDETTDIGDDSADTNRPSVVDMPIDDRLVDMPVDDRRLVDIPVDDRRLRRGWSRVANRNVPRPELKPEPKSESKSVAKPVSRCAPSRSAPLALMARRDVTWLRGAAAICQSEAAPLSPSATRVRDHLASAGASFLSDLCATIDMPPDEIEDALWELVGAGLATADGFASLRVLVDRKRGEMKSLFDKTAPNASAQPPARKWQDAIRKARTRDRGRPGHALRSLPTAAGRWSLLPTASSEAIDAEASARQLLLRYGVVFRDLVARESSLPPWRDLLVALRRLEARGEIRGGRFVNGFVGEQFALPEALDELRAARNPSAPCITKVAATDPLNLVGILTPGPRVPAIVGNAVLYVDGHAIASLEAGELVLRAALAPGARVDADLTYHPPPRPIVSASQAALPL